MEAATAWSLFIAGFTDTAFARRVATRFRAGPLEAVQFAEGEVSGSPSLSSSPPAATPPRPSPRSPRAGRPGATT